MMTSSDLLIYFIVAIVILIGLFLLGRELACWYFKINKLIEIQQMQLNNLRAIKKVFAPDAEENKKDDKTGKLEME
jgi:hypothetical protein